MKEHNISIGIVNALKIPKQKITKRSITRKILLLKVLKNESII